VATSHRIYPQATNLLKSRLLDSRITVINASSKDIKLIHVLIKASHQLMAKEPLTWEEEVEEVDVEVKAELHSKESSGTAASKATKKEIAGKRM
jgi:hypothetical protein